MIHAQRFTTFGLLALCVLLFLIGGARARALTINLTFDSSVTALPNAAQYEAATTYAAQQLESLFADNITINITVVADSDPDDFGESEFYLVGTTYAQIRSVLGSHATTTNDEIAVANLPTTDPTHGGVWYVTSAQAKALGLTGPSTESDGTFTFGSSNPFALNPNDRAVPGEYDFIGVAEHEMTEIMGRCSGLGDNFGDGNRSYLLYDLFRYTAPGAQSVSPGNNNYFSINSGETNLKAYNFPNGNGSDPQDWASGTDDACNAFADPDVVNLFSSVDVIAMDVIGYTPNLAPAVTSATSASGTVGQSFFYQIIALNNPTSFYASGYPNTLTVNTTTGAITGVPTTAGTFSFTISAINSTGTGATILTLTVAKGSQQISAFSVIPTQTYGASPLTLKLPTASSGLPVTVSVKSGPATLSGAKLTLTGAGAVTLSAAQAGNANYNAAASITTSFAVNKAAQTITFAALPSRSAGSGSFTLSATASSGLPVTFAYVSGPATLSGKTVTLTGAAGTVTLRASQGGNSDYNAATSVTQSFTVTSGKAQTITFPAIGNRTYPSATITLTATASSGLPVTYTCTGPVRISGNILTITGVGTSVVGAHQAGNATYAAAPEVRQAFTISP